MSFTKFALIEPTIISASTKHFIGLPPSNGFEDQRIELPEARVIILRESPDGGITLERYSARKEFAGDTWHPDIEEALEQAELEFSDSLGEWKEIPFNIPDILEFAFVALS